MTRTRDEYLFWRVIDTYGTPEPFGVHSHNDIKGIDYTIESENLTSPILDVRCLVNTTGIYVWLCTNYQGCGEAKSKKLSEQVPEGEEIATKFYPWATFSFDGFIGWTTSLDGWEAILKLYALKSQQ